MLTLVHTRIPTHILTQQGRGKAVAPQPHRHEFLRVEFHPLARVLRKDELYRVDRGPVHPQHLLLLRRARLAPPQRLLEGLLAPDASNGRVLNLTVKI